MTTKTNFQNREPDPLFFAQFLQAPNTNAPSVTQGAWRTLDLNTITQNDLPGVTLVSNQILAVPAGTYRVMCGKRSSHAGNAQGLRLYDVTGASMLVQGTVSYHDSASRLVGDNAELPTGALFALAVPSTLELQMYVKSNSTVSSTATNLNNGEPEVQCQLAFERIG